MRWGVPDGTRESATGELIHADDLVTCALCHELDILECYTPSPTVSTTPKDPMPEWDRNF